jgi:hypothetical protein
MSRRVRTAWVIVAVALPAWVGPPADPLVRLRDAELSVSKRVEAADAAWGGIASGDADLADRTRRAFRDVLWDARAPVDLRLNVLRKLLDDADQAERAESVRSARLLLPRERKWELVGEISERAARAGWTDFTPALIRAWSQPSREVKDTDRPERKALEALHPGRPIAEVVLDTFLNPGATDEVGGLDLVRRLRSDAWDLLGRVDNDASVRFNLLEARAAADPALAADPIVQDLRAGLADLRVMPFTGEELVWLAELRREPGSAWYAQTRAAVARAPEDRQRALQLRHLEPVRWSAEHRPERLTATRDALLADLRRRLEGRERRERTQGYADANTRIPERLEYWEPLLSWGDALAVLAVDEAVRDPAVIAAWATQIRLDRDDKTTEYGGVLSAAAEPGRFGAALFRPRPGQRTNDHAFAASEDMVRAADRALAHYHFHAQDWRQAEYSGPSVQDLIYAARSGRTQVVVTAVRRGVVNVDYYQPNGVIIDLGMMELPEKK